MITFAIGAEKIDGPLLYVDKTKDVYPFPRGLEKAPFKTEYAAKDYMRKHENKLTQLLQKRGFDGYDLAVIRVDAPHVVR